MESKIQAKIKRQLELNGWKVLKIIQLSENGYPDLLCLKNGNAMFIECKDVGKKPNKLQLHRIEQLKELGFKAFWTDGEIQI